MTSDGKLVDYRAKVARGCRTYIHWLVPTSHSESSLTGIIGLPDPAPHDTGGTYLGGISGDAAHRLVLLAELYDIAPDGTKTLVHRLVAPVRVPDVTKSFTVPCRGSCTGTRRGTGCGS